MEEEKKLEKRKNIEIVLLGVIIVILLGALIYLLFIKKDDKPVDNKGMNNQQEKVNDNNRQDEYDLIGKSFKTKDGKITLKIVDKNDKKAYDDAKEIYYSIENEKKYYVNDGVLYYGYLNNDVIEIKSIKKVDHYLIVDTELPSSSNILLNMKSNIIDEDDSRLLLNEYDRFFGDTGTNWYDVIKVNNGYFITSHNPADEYNLYTIFTTQWKKVGYYNDHNLKYENDGIYAFDNDKFTGSLIKYDINGNKIN